MKFLPFVLKHLRRNWIRTTSTVLAMAVCIFLVLHAAVGAGARSTRCWRARAAIAPGHPARGEPGVQPAAGLRGPHPGRPRREVAWPTPPGSAARCRPRRKGRPRRTTRSRRRPSTGATSSPTWPSRPSPTSPCTPSSRSPPDQWQDFLGDMRGAIIGRKLADKYGWKIGDRFYLESFIPPYRKRDGPFEFTVRAIFDTDLSKYPGTDTNIMFFHYKYLYEGTGQQPAGRAPTSSRSTIPPRRARSARPSTRCSRTATPRPTPRRRRPSAPASSPWPATWRSCSTASAWP